MTFLRLEDLFVAAVFAVVAGASGWALLDADHASPLVSSATVVMERSSEDTMPAVDIQPPEIQVADEAGHVCPCLQPQVARRAEKPSRAGLAPRPTYLN